MPETNIGSAVASDLAGAMTDFSVNAQDTDAIGDSRETRWQNTKWSPYLGYYKEIPELNTAIDAKATWTVGKGYTAEADVEAILENILGWGKDTFNTVLENMIRTSHIGGDAFCEIIRDDDGELINLKPLDPGVIIIVVGADGIIKRYEQISKIKGKAKSKKTKIYERLNETFTHWCKPCKRWNGKTCFKDTNIRRTQNEISKR